MSEAPPELIFIAGPNGAGKTTFATKFVPLVTPSHIYLNVDEGARLASPQLTGLQAARRHLEQVQSLLAHRRSLIIESTFSGLGYVKTMRDAKNLGYFVIIHYIQLPTVETSIRRVQKRVASGGHDIPEGDLRRRFSRSVINFEKRYKPIADEWTHYESRDGKFEKIASSCGRT
ncbi:MAG: zeta toxin family protein [Pseudomonadota bacterium]